MPTLNWIGKDKVINHHHDVPFRVLEHKYGFRSDNPEDKTYGWGLEPVGRIEWGK